jgi:hypothetical protein
MSNHEIATAYAAMKALERILENEVLPPGIYNLGSQSLTITFPQNTQVIREFGPKRDGIIEKKATQSLYGYKVWAMFLERLNRFNQANAVKKILMEVWHDAIRNDTTVDKKLDEIDPELNDYVETLKAQHAPKKPQPTPRQLEMSKNAMLQFNLQTVRKAA